MNIRSMKALLEQPGKLFPLPGETLLRNAGIDVEATRERYRSEFCQAQDAPERVWYPITSSTMETDADLRYRIELWHAVPRLAIEGTLQDVHRKRAKAYEAQVRNVAFEVETDPDGGLPAYGRRRVVRSGSGNGRAWRKHGHEILGFEFRDHVHDERSMHPTLNSALDAITRFDSGGGGLAFIMLPTTITFVDGEVMELLSAAAPVGHRIASPAGSAV